MRFAAHSRAVNYKEIQLSESRQCFIDSPKLGIKRRLGAEGANTVKNMISSRLMRQFRENDCNLPPIFGESVPSASPFCSPKRRHKLWTRQSPVGNKNIQFGRKREKGKQRWRAQMCISHLFFLLCICSILFTWFSQIHDLSSIQWVIGLGTLTKGEPASTYTPPCKDFELLRGARCPNISDGWMFALFAWCNIFAIVKNWRKRKLNVVHGRSWGAKDGRRGGASKPWRARWKCNIPAEI